MRRQNSLHNYFHTLNKEGTKIEIRRFFYLKWDNRKPAFQAQWLNESPGNLNFIEEVKWKQVRKTHTFYLCANIDNFTEKNFFIQKEPKYKNIPYLKSHLQKNIRKMDFHLAIPTAVHLIKLDLVELLRRLPIIMIEDVMLHESFTTLIWFMVAISSTNFGLKKDMYEWLLGLIYVLSNIPNKDIIQYSELPEEKLIDKFQTYHELSIDQASLLYCFHLRSAYGGMNCDIDMLTQYANIWYKRFKGEIPNSISINRDRIRPILFYSVKPLDVSEWDLSAIDFHCNTKLCELISKRYPEFTQDELKKIIWINSSSINKRTPQRIYEPENWNKLKEYILRTQKYLLDHSYDS